MFPPQGRFTIAAKHHITIAEIYETELVDIEKVCGQGRRWALWAPLQWAREGRGMRAQTGSRGDLGLGREGEPCQLPRLPPSNWGRR